ncbi:hypothetical protein C2869_16255 [Saccharobesus litoralis]|uniref:Uncharacterized protein n=2 Tax=Saccharobesus litoralis TaxID=2172099 RepID=A0A2S0VUW0_9ALTE|nr:hypothetical protein C2869_16255 [Saccharobesus litoralis]
MEFFGSQRPYWPELFSIYLGETKTVRFYERHRPLKKDNHHIDVVVTYTDGLLIFDANPYNYKIQNWGLWLPLSLRKYQTFANQSTGNNFSVSNVKGIVISILNPTLI